MKRPASTAVQDELPLSSIAAHSLFPGRASLYINEVARALEINPQQVVDLIQEYQDTDGASGLAAVNIASGLQSEANPKGNKTPRAYWRIPVSAYDAFIAARKNSTPVVIKKS